MTEILKPSINFSFRLLAILVVLYLIHELTHYLLGVDFGADLIQEAYWSNYLMVVITYFALMFAKQKNDQTVGFIFLGGFFFKLVIFMIFFNPLYKLDNEIKTVEFFAFFTPYSICLALETISLVRWLNRS